MTKLVDLSKLKVAIIHEWFVDYSGSERVVEQMLNVFPQADLFAQVEFLPDNLKWFIKNKPVKTSFIQKLPMAKTKYRNYLPLMPFAVEQFDMTEYDLIISSNHAVAKGVITSPEQLHICMCYSPVRYAWDLTHQYLRESGLDKGFKGWIAKYILHKLRIWDYRTANGVDEFIAISNFISKRIKKVYGRNSTIIYPPVDINSFELNENHEDYYLTVSRMVPYKKIDMIVEAFTRMPEKTLIVIGDGPDNKKIKKIVTPNIKLMGFQENDVVRNYMQRAKAFIFAAVEDFGIVPVEAQACGTPVIAYGKGGSLETVIDRETGLLFKEQTPESLIDAVHEFERNYGDYNIKNIRKNSEKFSNNRFRTELKEFMNCVISEHYSKDSHQGVKKLRLLKKLKATQDVEQL